MPRHTHLPAELLAWVDEGLIPSSAVFGLALMAGRGAEERRERWETTSRTFLRKGDPRGYRGVAIGFLTVEAVAPKAWERAQKVIVELRGVTGDRLAERRAERLTSFHSLQESPAMFDLLIAEARERIGESPDDAASWLALATGALVGLRRAGLPASMLVERELRLAAHEANVLRVRGRLSEAADAFAALAADPRRLEVSALAAHADLWSLEASLRTARREFAESARLLERAETASRALSDEHALARVLIKRGTLADLAGDLPQALELHRAAARLVDPKRHPQLHWTAHHNLADSLVSLGRAREAARVVAAAQATFAHCGTPANRLRADWLEGLIAGALGSHPVAEKKLRKVVACCVAQGRHYDGALARLDLARIYLATHRHGAVKGLARRLVADFRAHQVDREACIAARLFGRAARAEQMTHDLVTALRRYFALARLDPSYRFQPPAGREE